MEMSQVHVGRGGVPQDDSSFEQQDREDTYLFSDLSKSKRRIYNKLPVLCIVLMFLILLLTFVMAAVALGKSSPHSPSAQDTQDSQQLASSENQLTSDELGIQGEMDRFQRPMISRLAFGSCSAYDIRELPIFTEGIIKAEPQAWIWLGDMLYLDKPNFQCPHNYTQIAENSDEYDQCICDPDWVHVPPSCLAGDVLHAQQKFESFLQLSTYRQFVDYMCPDYYSTHKEGQFPPVGIDCLRPIVGTYDDHDFGWNDGDGRFEQKVEIQQLFLDAIGEPQNSARRSSLDGIQTQYVFNQQYPDKQIQLVLLDERYHRSAFPCEQQEVKCGEPVSSNSKPQCDSLFGANASQCCTWDGEVSNGFCKVPENYKQNPEFCDPSRQDFATKGFNGSVESPMCEVLGVHQRQWLSEVLQGSNATLHLIGSGSVVFGAGKCGGDNWECFKQAQQNFIYTLSNVTTGCVVILAGDYHFADIKMVQGGSQVYSDIYKSSNFQRPIYQLMSSGMSKSTATGKLCEGWKVDEIGLRIHGNCSMYSFENFGMVDVDWDQQVVNLSIRNLTGQIAIDRSGVAQQVSVDLKTCNIIQ
eukprot:TRINITY_DN1375_c0_g1_i4.p1 TRINITY_DN1375_c0_g1~~TRINITY_DN1375_c0_g1_i4.p1  ORF type:complete len:583 (-),score=83.82 TRINITY_DN1375_c0_g1_i4:129-1877(-)